jgi:hypothetical protein
MNRPDGPHNAPPVAHPSQGARAPAARPGDVAAVDVEALRARAARAVERQRPANATSPDAPDPGKVLARLPRPDGTELRVSEHLYEGRPFVRVAPWQQSGGAWWPVKGKGCTVKVRELAQVAAALLDAIGAAP